MDQIDHYLEIQQNQNEISKSKKIMLFVHKEIQLDKFNSEATYKATGDWHYQVIENLYSPLSDDSSKNHVQIIGKSCENILSELDMANNFDLFAELFYKSLESFIVSKTEFKYIQDLVVKKIEKIRTSKTSSNTGNVLNIFCNF